jgi:hypothetical protein
MHFNIGLVLATIDDYPRAVSSKELFFPYFRAEHEFPRLKCGPVFKLYNDTYPLFVHQLAAYSKAIELDQYFAVAYFQRGVSAFIIGDMDLACTAFDEAYTVCLGKI